MKRQAGYKNMVKRAAGFGLIEIIIAVAIVALLATVVLPNYQDSVMKTKRTAARGALMDVVSRQEQYFLNNKAYAGSLAALGLADPYYIDATAENVAATDDTRVYQISLDATTSTSYAVVATALLQQAKDGCGNFTLASNGSRSVSGTQSSNVCW
jgi:type IV pilus assembly protein PilE